MCLIRRAGTAAEVFYDATADGASKEGGVFRVVEEACVVRIVEESDLCEHGGDVRFIAGVEPIAAAEAAVVADDGLAGDAVVVHTPGEYIAINDASHCLRKGLADLIAIKGAFV